MKLRLIKKTLGVALMAMVSVSGMAQDLIARQAPSDKRLKDIKNVVIVNTFATQDLENPSSHIYTDWNNKDIRNVEGYVAPKYEIDLTGFCMPTKNRKVNSKFGRRWGRQHEGIDVKVYIGDTIYSAFDGKVRMVKFNRKGYGYYVVIRHTNGLETLYGHLSKQLVKEDQIVRAGEPIGLGGNTGRSSGSHLHFETRLLGYPLNPALMFDFEKQDVVADTYVSRLGKLVRGESGKQLAAASSALAINSSPTVPNVTNDEVEEVEEVTYKVKKGDSLYLIARRHGLTVSQLCRLNGLKTTSTIQPGMILKCS